MDVKASLGDDVRRVRIDNEDLTFNELTCLLQRLFKRDISFRDDLLLKYRDSDGDVVTLSDDQDLLLAKENAAVLRVVIFIKGPSGRFLPFTSDCKDNIINELKDMRSRIDALLEVIEFSAPEEPLPLKPDIPEDSGPKKLSANDIDELVMGSSTLSTTEPAVNNVSNSNIEFKQQHQQHQQQQLPNNEFKQQQQQQQQLPNNEFKQQQQPQQQLSNNEFKQQQQQLSNNEFKQQQQQQQQLPPQQYYGSTPVSYVQVPLQQLNQLGYGQQMASASASSQLPTSSQTPSTAAQSQFNYYQQQQGNNATISKPGSQPGSQYMSPSGAIPNNKYMYYQQQ